MEVNAGLCLYPDTALLLYNLQWTNIVRRLRNIYFIAQSQLHTALSLIFRDRALVRISLIVEPETAALPIFDKVDFYTIWNGFNLLYPTYVPRPYGCRKEAERNSISNTVPDANH